MIEDCLPVTWSGAWKTVQAMKQVIHATALPRKNIYVCIQYEQWKSIVPPLQFPKTPVLFVKATITNRLPQKQCKVAKSQLWVHICWEHRLLLQQNQVACMHSKKGICWVELQRGHPIKKLGVFLERYTPPDHCKLRNHAHQVGWSSYNKNLLLTMGECCWTVTTTANPAIPSPCMTA